MDDSLESENIIESTIPNFESGDGAKEIHDNINPSPKPVRLKKKRKYVSRKRGQKILDRIPHIKDTETRDSLLVCQDDESKINDFEENNNGQNKALNPFLVSYILSMVQQRRNNLFISLNPVSLFSISKCFNIMIIVIMKQFYILVCL